MPNDFKAFMTKDTAGLPNWAWLLVVGAGIAAAYLVPKFLASKSTANPSSSTGTSADTSGTTGLGLAVDPTTGLPYAVEGLVPSGAYAGTPGNLPPVPTPTPTPTPAPPPAPVAVAGKDYPLIPYGTQGLPNYSNLARNTFWTYNGTRYQLEAGPLGHLYGIDANGNQVLLYAPASFYPGGTNYHGPGVFAHAGGPNAGLQPVVSSPMWPGGTLQIRMAQNGSG